MNIPADIPAHKRDLFAENLHALTNGMNRFFLFAADQKIEHLNTDFYGPHIHPDAADPEHLFRIAQAGHIGAFATQFGLITRYGAHYPTINYVVKLNSKTNIIDQSTSCKQWYTDPLSTKLWSIHDVIELKRNSGLQIRGVGYTVYIGSTFESSMLKQAANIIHHAHQEGLVVILWIYPRGYCIADDTHIDLVAGAAGVATALGADIVKIKPPSLEQIDQCKHITKAAGNTLVIASGGEQVDEYALLQRIYTHIHQGHLHGAAIGRNIFQHALPRAIHLTQAIEALVYHNATYKQACSFLA